jgi:hypothetical protein
MKSTDVWIGRFDVRPRPGNGALGLAKGAIVNVVALAEDQADYVEVVRAAMNDYEFEVICSEDVSRLAEWTKVNRLDEELACLVEQLTREFPVQFDELQSYLHDDG